MALESVSQRVGTAEGALNDYRQEQLDKDSEKLQSTFDLTTDTFSFFEITNWKPLSSDRVWDAVYSITCARHAGEEQSVCAVCVCGKCQLSPG